MAIRILSHHASRIISILLLLQTALASDYWVVDQSNGVAPSDTWWTGCKNNTGDGSVSDYSSLTPCDSKLTATRHQQNLTLAHTINTQACLDWYYWGGLKDTWQGTTCNDFGFFRGSNQYSDSAACYEKCYGCLSQSIQAGSTDAMCRDAHGYSAVGMLQGKYKDPTK